FAKNIENRSSSSGLQNQKNGPDGVVVHLIFEESAVIAGNADRRADVRQRSLRNAAELNDR
ncbi:MAG: hypothetical protein KDD44_12255, partial [Bdellovibrionales bacterium]|nr:hypothetical protein [Bdellovibrionales bacterium]